MKALVLSVLRLAAEVRLLKDRVAALEGAAKSAAGRPAKPKEPRPVGETFGEPRLSGKTKEPRLAGETKEPRLSGETSTPRLSGETREE